MPLEYRVAEYSTLVRTVTRPHKGLNAERQFQPGITSYPSRLLAMTRSLQTRFRGSELMFAQY